MIYLSVLLLLLVPPLGLLAWELRRRHVHRWLLPYLLAAPKRRRRPPGGEVHLLLCIADHFEPKENHAPADTARARVQRWVHDYPRQLGRFCDSDGRPPRHTFFYPVEEYVAEYLDALAGLCAAGFGEVEVHLHHDHDTPAALRARLLAFKEVLAERHGLLCRDRATGALAYGFVHGNWALNNSRPDGRWCGVDHEIEVLHETGCYADFTYPSAPSPTQPSRINSIYYAPVDSRHPRAHEHGPAAGHGPVPPRSLLMVQGPLALSWRQRKWGLLPHIENGCLQDSQPPAIERLEAWLRAQVQVPNRPDWFFVKLHTHGAREAFHDALLGEAMIRFHQALADYAREHPRFHYHYVTAREMYNLVRAAEAGWQGTVAEARDYQLVPNDGGPDAFPTPARAAAGTRQAPAPNR